MLLRPLMLLPSKMLPQTRQPWMQNISIAWQLRAMHTLQEPWVSLQTEQQLGSSDAGHGEQPFDWRQSACV